MYREPGIGKIKSVGGNLHEYFPITLDYTTRGEENINIRKYVKKNVDGFTINIDKSQVATRLSTDNLLKAVRSNPQKNNKS